MRVMRAISGVSCYLSQFLQGIGHWTLRTPTPNFMANCRPRVTFGQNVNTVIPVKLISVCPGNVRKIMRTTIE